MLVSIIIPTKNRRDLLCATLASITAQTHENWEAIVVDDGSDDGTEKMVQSMASTEKRVRFVRRDRTPPGAPTCRNMGISASNGEYIIFLDSDDLLAAHCLERRVKVMEQNPQMDFAVFLTQIFQATPGDSPYLWNLFNEEDDLDRFLRRDPPWQTSGPLWRKTCLAKIGLWDERALCAQDWEFHIRAIASGLNYLKISETDSYWRTTRPGSISSLWATPRHVCNRIRLFKRVIAGVRSRGLLTERRRRILAGEFYKHAFQTGQSRRVAYRIWRAGWRAKIVARVEFMIMLFCERAAGKTWRANHFFEVRLFPDWQVRHTHTNTLLPPAHLPASDIGRLGKMAEH
jgi:glycosyltransferase involved in cell wall biosynthesis